MILSTLLGLSTQSLIPPFGNSRTWYRTATHENLPGLVLTNPVNLFSFLKPATNLQLPTFSAASFVPSLSWNTQTPEVTTTAPLVQSTIPSFRIPVSTRPPGVPHHDDIVLSEFKDGVHRIVSNRQTFEFRDTRKQIETTKIQSRIDIKEDVPVAKNLISTPVETPASIIDQTTTNTSPPLIHYSDEILSNEAAVLTILSPPEIPYQQFFGVEPSTIISKTQTLPFETNVIPTTWN